MSARSKRNKFNNYCRYLSTHFDILSGKEQFDGANEMVLKCKRAGHEKCLKGTSIANKKHFLRDLELWCDACNREARHAAKTQSFTEEIDEKLGHSIVSVDWSNRRVEYKCVNCGEVRHNFVHNLKRKDATGRCDKCQNNDRRLPYEQLCETVKKHGKTLVTLESQYQNNKQKLDVLCECGRSYGCRLADIRLGKSCNKCLYDRQQARSEMKLMDTYGVRNAMHIPEVMQKITTVGFSTKPFTFASGRVVDVQGYEPQALSYLLEHGVIEEDMTFGINIPRLFYLDADGKSHVYYPDVFLQSTQTVVEVKSLYTLLKELETNRLKWKAAIANGYIFRLIVFTDKSTFHSDNECTKVDDIDALCDQF